MADWIFSPPTVEEAPAGLDPLFYRVKLTRGVSIQELPQGSFRDLRYPTQDEISDAYRFWMGGHRHIVDDATKAALIAAGVGVDTSNFTAA